MKEKKIGIITFHRALNAGAALQAFALKNYLAQFYKVDVVDYRSPKIEADYYYSPNSFIDWAKYVIRYAIFFPIYFNKSKKKKKYIDFQKKYLVSGRVYTPDNIHEASNNYNIFIAGSDQIWNPKWSGNDMNYFLEFARSEQKYSYAASFGGMSLTNGDVNILEKLADFKFLSIREKDKAILLKELLDKKRVDSNCDPVFLLNKEQWEQKLKLRKGRKQYILLYIIAEGDYIINFTKKLSEITGYNVIYLNNSGLKTNIGVKEIIDFGPIDFINFIYGAEYVITTSFHALAFSLIFNVPFYYELNKKKNNDNNRLNNLIELFCVEDREIKTEEAFIRDIDWKSINEISYQYSLKSSELLRTELNLVNIEY